MAENNEKNDEQIFNEDELQDIMNEFENLEREFQDGSDEAVGASPTEEAEPVAETPAAEEEVLSEGQLNVMAETDTYVTPDNVVPMSSAKPSPKAGPAPTASTSTQSVSMSLEFPIGEQVAQIGISPEYGFSFNMDGVELTIDEENGCVMTLPGGMTFTIPVQKSAKHKKSA